ncbi:MAG TPA: type II toxin-antitoxin system RelE/ParE family toxin [Blastocatellia bacterium]|nr:type II toxin-antitoxin system RelE/ParE family toxin [Blastocatellia bacterium]
MIRTFASKKTEKIFHRQPVQKFPPDLRRAPQRKLLLLDAAEQLDDLLVPPGNRLEKLAGDRKGQHSIRINDQWRICFRWSKGDAYDVEIVDYH